jgi:NADH-quinone oxidoreductase subunit N
MSSTVAWLPAAILAAAGLAILIAGRPGRFDRVAPLVCYVALLIAAIIIGSMDAGIASAASGVPSQERQFFINDPLARGAAWIALVFGFLIAVSANRSGGLRPNWLGWLLLAVSGVLLAAAANDMLVVLLALFLSTLPASGALFTQTDVPNARTKGAISLALHLLAFCFVLIGAALICEMAGTTNLAELRMTLAPHAPLTRHNTLVGTTMIAGDIGTVLLIAGLGIPLLAVPFQLAAAEVLEETDFRLASLSVLFARGAALLLMIRVLLESMPRYSATVQSTLTAVALLTILIGAVLALSQTRLQRLIVFTATTQTGIILAGLAAGCSELSRPSAAGRLTGETPGGVGAACLCFAFDALALLGIMAILGSGESPAGQTDERGNLSARLRGDPCLKAALCVLLIGVAGLPPLAGFWAHVALLRSVLTIALPAEHGFLPHQNVDYVIFTAGSAAALVVLAAIYMNMVGKILFNGAGSSVRDAPHSSQTLDEGGGVRRAPMRCRAGACVGILAAALLVVFGFFPAAPLRLAAHATAPARQNSGISVAPTGPQRGKTSDHKPARRAPG